MAENTWGERWVGDEWGEHVCVQERQCGENGPAHIPQMGLNSISSPTGVLFIIPEINHTGCKEKPSGDKAPCRTHEGLGGPDVWVSHGPPCPCHTSSLHLCIWSANGCRMALLVPEIKTAFYQLLLREVG